MISNRIIIAMFSCAAVACEAITLTGPGDAVISSAAPISFVEDAVRLGGNVQAVYEGCLGTTNIIVFKDVQLSDIQSTSVCVGSKYHTGTWGRWLTADTYFRTENSDGTLDFEMQASASVLMGCVVRLTQCGADVAARIVISKYQSGSYAPGAISFRAYGASMSVVEDELFTGSSSTRCAAWKNLTAVLASSPVQMPQRIVFDNVCTEATNCLMASIASEPFTAKTPTLVWKDTDLSSVTSFQAKLGGGKVGNTWRQALPCNIVRNANGTVQVRFNYGTYPVISVRMLFEQHDNDVFAKINDARYAWAENKDPGYNFDGSYGYGAELTVISEETSSIDNTVSIKDVGCQWTRSSIYDEFIVNDGFASTNWQTLVKNADIEDVVNVAATMSGSLLYNSDQAANIVNVATNDDGSIDSQYQYVVDGSKLVGVMLRYEQAGPDIRYRVWKTGYQWDKPIGFDMRAQSMGGSAPLVETIGGTGVSLRNMKFVRRRKELLPVVLGEFDIGDRPVKLRNVELLARGTAAECTVFSGLLYGTGRVVVDGSARIEQGADFIVPLSLTSRAELHIGMKNGSISPLSVQSFSAEDGATIVLDAESPPAVVGPLCCPLVSGEVVNEVGSLNVRLAGALSGRYNATVVSNADGSLQISLTPIRGLVVVVK